MESRDETIDRIDAGEDAWHEDDEVVELEIKQPLKVVVPIRLTPEHWEALHKEAKKLGVGPTTLARMWLLERLNQKAAAPKP
jgi:hypothetical protein